MNLRYYTLAARSRRAKLSNIFSALSSIGYSNRYYGASTSVTIDFDGSYNRRDQRAIYGVRTRGDVAEMARAEQLKAEDSFAMACDYCEFRCVPGKCQGTADEDRVFKLLSENAQTRARFSARLKNTEVESGYKAAPCLKLLQKARLKKEDWVVY